MSEESHESSEDRLGVNDHILANIFLDEAMEKSLIKIGSLELVEGYKKLQSMYYALPAIVIEDLKNLTLREVKEKYGLEGDKINSEFIVTNLYRITVKGK